MVIILSLLTPGHGLQWGLMVHIVFIHSMLASTMRNIPAKYVHRIIFITTFNSNTKCFRVTSYSAAIQSTTSLHTRHFTRNVTAHHSHAEPLFGHMHYSIYNTKQIKWNLLSCNSIFLTHSTNAVIRVCKHGHILLSHFPGFDSTCIDSIRLKVVPFCISGCISAKPNTKVDVRHQQEKCKNSGILTLTSPRV